MPHGIALRKGPLDAIRHMPRLPRLDIQGLRAVAVLAVVVYHLNSKWLPGGFIGVDIFFVISGFLITGHLVDELERHGRISLAKFYSKRVLRLIPAATVVLLSTIVAVVLFVPKIVWSQIATEIIGAATYSINWILAARSVNYLAEDSPVSPVQHFWSLAVEEQFYAFWPLLIIGAALAAAKVDKSRRRAIAISATSVLVFSFAAAMFAVNANDVTSYFSTFTRLWELAVGALAVLITAALKRKASNLQLGVIFSAGALAVLASIFFIVDAVHWPSVATVIPVFGSALILMSGGGPEGRSLPEKLLSLRPLVWFGGISYALYLWHWPLLVIAGYATNNLSLPKLLLVASVAIVLAWLTQLLVENPIRFSPKIGRKPKYGLLLAAGCALISVIAATGLLIASPSSALAAPRGAVALGAAVLSPSIADVSASSLERQPLWVSPRPQDATADLPEQYATGCQQNDSGSAALACEYGDKKSPRTMVLVGDSKIGQWLPALDEIAKRSAFKIVLIEKAACPFADAPSYHNGRRYVSCAIWYRNAVEAIKKLSPEIVVTSQVQSFAWSQDGNQNTSENHDVMAKGIEKSFNAVRKIGAKVVMIADTPFTPRPIYQCVADKSDTVSACTFPLVKAVQSSAIGTQRIAARELNATMIDAKGISLKGSDNLAFLDLTDYICPPQVSTACPAAIGNALVYRQGSHLTATYIKTLTPTLENMFKISDVLN